MDTSVEIAEIAQRHLRLVNELEALDTKFRSGLTGDQRRSVTPWMMMGRGRLAQEELTIWRLLARGEIAETAAFDQFSELMERYYSV